MIKNYFKLGLYTVQDLFGSMVFNEAVIKARLPRDVYQSIKRTMNRGTHLDPEIADVVANAMMEWALEKGATHYTHWFQPMTGITAEKHESFISPAADGNIIMEFSGKELIRGESDASSLPSGGLRATFEARGYTAWDPTSYAFIKNGTLCIPTAFCSYGGEALDKKTPLLRSMEALERQAIRILHLFGNTEVKRVLPTVGAEQEYFLIDKKEFEKRPDLMFCGRTLFGERPPKGQELEDHYYGTIKPRINSFMKELEEELWKLGVMAKTRHNETAPSQHELASIYNSVNIATDHNQIIMELLKSVAAKHELSCLLHEKPFAGINGSGKHNNWSLATDSGVNLLEPGESPSENAQFLLFLTAVLAAVDKYQDLLRVSVASAGNDHRLGGFEAPPAIISVFLGSELLEILESLENGTSYIEKNKLKMELGVTRMPDIPKDSTDRNRTSPFAFSGNKFEFRMPGSAFSIAGPNIVLNTALAEVLSEFADYLENAANFYTALKKLMKKTISKHKRIIFNGNNYCKEWLLEAEKRGLSNLKTTVDSLPLFASESSIKLFTKHKVYTETEIKSRCDILLEIYSSTIKIEAMTIIDMLKKEILPSSISFQKELCNSILLKENLNNEFSSTIERNILKSITILTENLYSELTNLETALSQINNSTTKNALDTAKKYKETVIPHIECIRKSIDPLESLIPKKYWPYPTYAEILYSVK